VETRFCYPGGIGRVNVHAGTGDADFTAIDNQKDVPLYFSGGPGRDSLSVAADVPSSVGTFHNLFAPVHFAGGAGSDDVSYVDDRAVGTPTYTIGNGVVRRSDLPPVVLDDSPETIELYPQDGKATIKVGRTGAQFVQLFGAFFGQKGPYRIDARGSDAPLVGQGSEGNDTILGSALSDGLATGGGSDTVDIRDSAPDSLDCEGGAAKVRADTLDRLSRCPASAPSKPLVGLLLAAFTSKSVKHGKRAGLEVASTVGGRLTLRFTRKHAKSVTGTANVKAGPNSLRVRTGKLAKGSYKVSARVRKGKGKAGPAVTLHLRVR
jgi:hypothetical protein